MFQELLLCPFCPAVPCELIRKVLPEFIIGIYCSISNKPLRVDE